MNKKLAKSALILSIISSVIVTAQANAYDRYTWSELVTGPSNNPVITDKLSVVTEWCGLTRIVDTKDTNIARMKSAQQVIINKSKYTNNALFKAVMDLRYIYLYSFKDLKRADEVLAHLDSVPELKIRAEAERLFSSFSIDKLKSKDFYENLYNLKNKSGVFPYNNGYMPIITEEHAATMLAIKEMLEGKGKQFNAVFEKSWKNMPSDILYLIATDQRENAYKLFQTRKSSYDPKTIKLIEDFMYPLYMPVKKADRKLLTGIFCVEKFPGLGMDLINESLTDSIRVSKPEHALACLSEVYSKHNAYNEAQKVLKLLTEYYPNSIWLK